MTPRPPVRQAPFPTADQLERMGLVRCIEQPCTTWVDPVNLPGQRCVHHQTEQDRRERGQRAASRPRVRDADLGRLEEMRFAPRPERRRRERPMRREQAA